MDVMRRVLAVLLLSAALQAQNVPPAQTTGSLSATGSVPLNVSGYASVAFQVTGTWVGTITFEGSIDAVTYQAINVTPTNSSSTVTTTTANGVWTGSVGGLRSARARMSAYTSGTAVITVQAAASGGGSGGGGGGAASSVTINDPTTTTQKAAVNASGQLSITCANCSGSGASAVDNSAFTAGTTSGAPAMGFFHSTIDAVTDNSTATLGMDAKRNLFTVLRDAAGNARGVNVTAGNALTIDGSGFTQPVSGTFWQATQPVSGTVTATQGTAAAGTAGWPVLNGSGSQATATWTSATSIDSTVALATMNNFGSAIVTIRTTSTITGGVVTFEASDDGTNYFTVTATRTTSSKAETTYTLVATTSQAWQVYTSAWVRFRVRLSTVITGTGSAVVLLTPNSTDSPSSVTATQSAAADLNATVVGSGAAGTAATGVVTVQGIASMTKLLVTPDSVALPANQSTNVAQVAGTTTDTNSGTKSAGTLRVVLATDQPALTNKLLVTPDSVALPANQSVNVAQLAGTATSVNSGTKDAGTIRVVIATDQVQLTNKLLVTPDSVALPANQSVNISQMNGVTVTMGAGATGTGVQRTNDVASSATGAAPPAAAAYVAGLGSGATAGFGVAPTVCDTHKAVSMTSATTTLMVTGVSGRHVRICALHLVTAIANNVALVSGTGATCGTGTAGIAGGSTAANGYNFAANGGIAIGSGFGEVMRTVATGDSVCIITSAAGPLAGNISYAIY